MRFSGTIKAFAAVMAMILLASCGGQQVEEEVLLGVTLKTTAVSADEGSVFVAVTSNSSWTLSIEGGTWASLSQTSGTGDKGSVILTYQANEGESARSITVKAVSGSASSSATLTQSAKEKVEDQETDTTPTPSGTTMTTAPYHWLELPETSDRDDLDYFVHYFSDGVKDHRNYSFYWDYDNLVARWVAYPLSNWTIYGPSDNPNAINGRTDAWALDPLLSENSQPVLYKGFKDGNNGWYARGHQIPSADRYFNYKQNAQTFYGTNMTPQLNDNFNGKIWANLEIKFRNWASQSDTLYVVTGCLVKDAKYYALDNVGKKVTVPTHYFKAAVRYKKNASLGYGGYMGFAVLLDHKDYTENNISKNMTDASGSKVVMSIDALEEKTGIDFFVHLPEVIGEDAAAKLEAEDPTTISWWW